MSTFIDTQRVQLLRSARGLTQTDLANALDVPSSTFARIENGRLEADESVIEVIARSLGCSPKVLTTPIFDVLYTRPWLRAYADAPKKTVDQYVADTLLAVENIDSLHLRRMPDRLPAFSGDPQDEADVDDFALEVRQAADVPMESGVPNVTRAAERLGCVVLPMDHELGKHLGLSTRVDDVPVIRVSRAGERVPGDRQRFTMAHELGHILLHSTCPPPDSSEQAREIEKQAHRFASAFLLPGDAFLEDLSTARGNRVTLSSLLALKERWGVAIKAMVVRLQQLGRIDSDQARSLYKQISARGWNTGEPIFVGNERAVWLTKALDRRFPGGTAYADAARVAGLDVSWFESWTNWDELSEPSAEVLAFAPRAGRRTRVGTGGSVTRLGQQ
ncbi:helix-turn-helix domain-containing protein [Terrabacter sp. C0L_2]|uniref:helix-turn-helix domain-containing protein n=1 Tax=Terrabacter sp. C0L_2 TaxID=3108389 RepID=UPI002ED26654|nr:XRE family transcriptional regulator [Terrabacter sp. C0L_2]